MVETEARSPAERPGAFIIACFKCCREYELHGVESRLQLILDAQGWVRDGERMICPHCPAPREQFHNKAKEEARRGGRLD